MMVQARNITEAATVRLKYGQIRGGFEPSFYYFKGIPYAEPPVGKLRFQPPQPLSTFGQSPLDCTRHRRNAVQKNMLDSAYSGVEDCLYLNVYTPDLNRKLPVMFWIHGGAFNHGSGNSEFYSPDYLIPNDVVVVTINYRLGPLGFLCYPKLGIYGNMGLKDQQMALKWVNENIAAFGGDPGSVTLFGESAGGASVHLHLLNAESRKYFHKAICQSGNSIVNWGIQDMPHYKSAKLAEVAGAANESEHYNTLMTADPIALTKLMYKTLDADEWRRGLAMPFKPVIEEPNETAFMTETPLTLIKQKNCFNGIHVISGVTDMEGILMSMGAKTENYLADVCKFVPRSLNLTPDSTACKMVGKEIQDFYLGDEKDEQKVITQMTKFQTDSHFGVAHYMNAELMAHFQPNSKHFMYRFSFVGELNIFKNIFGPNIPGACHIDDLCYLFKMPAFDEPVADTSAEAGMRRLMCRMWSNFAKFG